MHIVSHRTVAQVRLARVIPSMHVHLCVVLWLFLFTRLLFLFVPLLFFRPFQMSSSEFHERLKSKSLCDFRLGTVATSDHETPLTDRKPKVIYTDNSLEFSKACEDLSWNHCTSTPHRSETNGIAERAVRRVKEGTSAVLLQSSLNENWWTDSMECYTYLRNVQDLLSDGKTPYERRFG